MPKVDGIGYSEATPQKIEHLRKIIEMHLNVTQAVIRRFNKAPLYRYVDLTAGMGQTPDGTVGSPIVFVQSAEASHITVEYHADLIEYDREHLEALKASVSALQPKGSIDYYCCDYMGMARRLFATFSDAEHGLVYVDPSGEPPDFETLRYISDMRPRMEILAYVSTTNIKRLIQHTGKHLNAFMADVGKQHWLVRKPSKNQHKWTFLLGSNYPFKDYKKIGFIRLETDEGAEIFESLNYTEQERRDRRQPRLM